MSTINTPENAIELHVFTEDVPADLNKLADFCEKEGLEVIRLFWRGVEMDDITDGEE